MGKGIDTGVSGGKEMTYVEKMVMKIMGEMGYNYGNQQISLILLTNILLGFLGKDLSKLDCSHVGLNAF